MSIPQIRGVLAAWWLSGFLVMVSVSLLCAGGTSANTVAGGEDANEVGDYDDEVNEDEPVHVPINFETKNSTVTVKSGDSPTLVCKVDTFPSDIQLMWSVKYDNSDKAEPDMIFVGEVNIMKSDKFVQKTYRQDDIKGSSLTIKSVTKEDSGQYGCVIANQEQKKLFFEVQVQSPSASLSLADSANSSSNLSLGFFHRLFYLSSAAFFAAFIIMKTFDIQSN